MVSGPYHTYKRDFCKEKKVSVLYACTSQVFSFHFLLYFFMRGIGFICKTWSLINLHLWCFNFSFATFQSFFYQGAVFYCSNNEQEYDIFLVYFSMSLVIILHVRVPTKANNTSLREKCPNTEFFLVRIFLYSNWIRRFTP